MEGIDPAHSQPMGTWSDDQVKSSVKENVMLTWAPSKMKNNLPIITHGEGVYLYDTNGKKYLDWTSQAVCTNGGHTVSENVKSAVMDQLSKTPFVYGGMAMCEVRARLSNIIGAILPQGLNGCAFPSSGSEANEAAITMARRFTGKTKIINWYRSYHGGTAGERGREGGGGGHEMLRNGDPYQIKPTGQVTQLSCPARGWKVPGAQRVKLTESVRGHIVPLGQSCGVRPGQYQPRSHLV